MLLIKQRLESENRFDDEFFKQLAKALEKLKNETMFRNATNKEKLLGLNQMTYISDYLKMKLYIEEYEDKYEVIRFGFSKYNIKLNNPFQNYYIQKVRVDSF